MTPTSCRDSSNNLHKNIGMVLQIRLGRQFMTLASCQTHIFQIRTQTSCHDLSINLLKNMVWYYTLD